MSSMPLTRLAVFKQAWPIIVGQALVPFVGIVDAAVIGRLGVAASLAGVALGASIVSFVLWSFGFLRMGVTGITAQAHGAGDTREVQATLLRAVSLGAVLGALVLLLSPWIAPAAVRLMGAPAEVVPEAERFVRARLCGAPAALAFYAINGWLLGLGRTGLALVLQVVLNGINVGLDVLFVGGFGWGTAGVGAGTSLAEWAVFVCGLLACRRVLGVGWRATARSIGQEVLWARRALRRLIAVNADLMVRTLALLALFTWFAHAGARLGTVPLAANHVLMQLVALSAFVLDGFAFTAEARVGAAVGADSNSGFRRAVRLTAEFSFLGGAILSLATYVTGPLYIDLITRDPATRAMAREVLPYCALIPFLGAASWLLDGVFIGATRGRVLRNAALVSTSAYWLTDHALARFADHGVWLALLASYGYRALSLGVCLPRLARRVGVAEGQSNAAESASA